MAPPKDAHFPIPEAVNVTLSSKSDFAEIEDSEMEKDAG